MTQSLKAECPAIPANYELKLPNDLRFHYNAAVNTWWQLGSIHEVDNPEKKYGFLLGLYMMTFECNMTSSLLKVKFLTDLSTQHHVQESAITPFQPVIATAVPYSVTLNSQNYFRQTSGKTFVLSETIIDHDDVVTLKLNGVDQSGLRKSGNNGIEHYCGFNIPEVVYSRIKLEGTLTRNGVSKKVSGTMIADRTWAGGDGERHCFYHYTWLFAQLDNGMDVIIYAFRDKDGAYTDQSFMNINYPDGRTQYLSAREFKIQDSHPWTSAATHVTYHIEQDVEIPQLAVRLHFKPVIENNECIR